VVAGYSVRRRPQVRRSAENDEGPASSLIAGPSVVRVGGALLVHRHLVDVIAEHSIHHDAAEDRQRGAAIAGFDSAPMLYVALGRLAEGFLRRSCPSQLLTLVAPRRG